MFAILDLFFFLLEIVATTSISSELARTHAGLSAATDVSALRWSGSQLFLLNGVLILSG